MTSGRRHPSRHALAPEGRRTVPAVVLVHGSGPHDRDETVGGTRVFEDLAQGLASRGVAVLRYEKRTKTYQKELAGTREMTLEDEVLDDAVAALAVLRAAPGRRPVEGVRPRTQPRWPARSADRAPGRKDGRGRPPRRAVAPDVRGRPRPGRGPYGSGGERGREGDGADSSPRGRRARRPLRGAAARIPSATIFGAPPAYWLELKAQTPAATAARLGLPLLVLQGGRDYQVSGKDFAGWQRALKGVPRATLKTYPDLNHLFVAGEGPSAPAEYEKPGHVDREVVEDIATFIARGSLRTGGRKAEEVDAFFIGARRSRRRRTSGTAPRPRRRPEGR